MLKITKGDLKEQFIESMTDNYTKFYLLAAILNDETDEIKKQLDLEFENFKKDFMEGGYKLIDEDDYE